MANYTGDTTSDMECNEEEPSDKLELLTLPIEIIKNILLYVDDQSRPKTTLVCRTFHELICELERDKIPLDLVHSQVRNIFLFFST